MRTCKEISELISRSMDQPLSWRERWALKTHLMMCGGCRRLNNQIAFLKAVAGHSQTADLEADETAGPGLSDEARERIRSAVASAAATTADS